jgi:hypothetical protein
MSMYWKVTNRQTVPTKVAVATASNGSVGVILQPNQFCLCTTQMTKMLDAQSKRGFVSIDQNYDNEYGFETGVAIDEGFIPESYAQKSVKEFKSGN